MRKKSTRLIQLRKTKLNTKTTCEKTFQLTEIKIKTGLLKKIKLKVFCELGKLTDIK